MFNFPDSSKVNKELEINSLKKLLKLKDKDVSEIKKVRLINILNESTLNIKSTKNIKDIYIIQIDLLSFSLHEVFFEKLNNYLLIPTLYIFKFRKIYNYFLPLRTIKGNKVGIDRVFASGWGQALRIEMPQCDDLQELYYKLIECYTKVSFNKNESYNSYSKRLIELSKRKDKEIYKGNRGFDFPSALHVSFGAAQNDIALAIWDILETFNGVDIYLKTCERYTKKIESTLKSFKKLDWYYKNLNIEIPYNETNFINAKNLKKAIEKTMHINKGIFDNRFFAISVVVNNILKKLLSCNHNKEDILKEKIFLAEHNKSKEIENKLKEKENRLKRYQIDKQENINKRLQKEKASENGKIVRMQMTSEQIEKMNKSHTVKFNGFKKE